MALRKIVLISLITAAPSSAWSRVKQSPPEECRVTVPGTIHLPREVRLYRPGRRSFGMAIRGRNDALA